MIKWALRDILKCEKCSAEIAKGAKYCPVCKEGKNKYKTTSALPGLKSKTIPAFQRLLLNADKNMVFDRHDHFPKPFGWEPFGPSSAFGGLLCPSGYALTSLGLCSASFDPTSRPRQAADFRSRFIFLPLHDCRCLEP
jgi:hypothetical protein